MAMPTRAGEEDEKKGAFGAGFRAALSRFQDKRRALDLHGLMSFLYATGILALTINMVAGVI